MKPKYVYQSKAPCHFCQSPTRGALQVEVLKEEKTQLLCFSKDYVPRKVPVNLLIPLCTKCRGSKLKIRQLGKEYGFAGDRILSGEANHQSVPDEELVMPQKGQPIDHINPERVLMIMGNPKWISEPKIDGARALGYLLPSKLAIFSSRVSKRTGQYSERTENFPHLRDSSIPSDLVGSIIDGEMLVEKQGFMTKSGEAKGTLNATVAVMNADPYLARQLQEDNACPSTFIIFDCYKRGDHDVKSQPLSARRVYAEEIVRRLGNPYIRFIDDLMVLSPDKKEAFKQAVDGGFEGTMIKNLDGAYYRPSESARNPEMVKWKKKNTYDAFITGVVDGEVANKGLVGSFIISMMDNGVPREVGAFSNFTRADRKLMVLGSDYVKSFMGKCVEVKAQEVTKNCHLRHCLLFRWRPDKSPDECQFDLVPCEVNQP